MITVEIVARVVLVLAIAVGVLFARMVYLLGWVRRR